MRPIAPQYPSQKGGPRLWQGSPFVFFHLPTLLLHSLLLPFFYLSFPLPLFLPQGLPLLRRSRTRAPAYMVRTIKLFENPLHALFTQPPHLPISTRQPVIFFSFSSPLSPNDFAKGPHSESRLGQMTISNRPFGTAICPGWRPPTHIGTKRRVIN